MQLVVVRAEVVLIKKKVSKECLEPQFLGYRCPNLVWSKEDVIREAKRGVREIVSRCGFTAEAVLMRRSTGRNYGLSIETRS